MRQAFPISSLYYALFGGVYWSPLCLISSITPVSKQLDPTYTWGKIVAHLSEIRDPFFFSTLSEGMNGYDSVILEVTNPVL